MTAIVGILCQGGVVIGTDSSATFGTGKTPTIEQPCDKLHIIGDSIVVAGSGPVGLLQRFLAIVENGWNKQLFKGDAISVVKILSKYTIEDFASTYVKEGQFSALVAFPIKKKYYLCEFAQKDLQPELKGEGGNLWYVSLGVTQSITDSFLAIMRKVLWPSGPPPIPDGVFSTAWALQHAIDVNTGGVNEPAHIAICYDSNLRVELQKDISEHKMNIEDAIKALGEHCKNLIFPKDKIVPDVPKP
jgi:hypothetical protein